MKVNEMGQASGTWGGGGKREMHKNCGKNLKEKTILKVLAQTGEYH